MSLKPTKLPRWAATAPGTITGDVVEPTSGKKDLGFVAGERPPAEYLDWLFELGYEWDQYLSDGDLEINGGLWPKFSTSISNATVNDWDPTSGSLPGHYWIHVTGGGSSAKITGLTGGTDGRVVVIFNATGADLKLAHMDTGSNIVRRFRLPNGMTAGDTITVPQNGAVAMRWESGGGLTNEWRLVWASFSYDTAALEVMLVDAACARAAGTQTYKADATHASEWDPNADATWVVYPIRLPVGAIVRSWKLYAFKSSNATKTITASFWDFSSVGGVTQIGSTKSNAANNPGTISLKDTGLTTTLAAGHSYGVAATGDAALNSDAFYMLEVSYTRVFMPQPSAYTP